MKDLPQTIKYDLQGYRGFDVVDFKLTVENHAENTWCASYDFPPAEYALYVAFGRTCEEAINNLKNMMI